MNADGELLELATVHGIETGYHDIWGTWHPLSHSSAIALLRGMGVPVDDAASIAGALGHARGRDWQSMLPPVHIAREGESIGLPLCLPGACDSHIARWHLQLEDGGERSGEAPVADLAAIDEHDAGDGPRRRRRLDMPAGLPCGYHRLSVTVAGDSAHMRLIVAPQTCHPPPDHDQGVRTWGIALQLYALRSQHNWGIGDFRDLVHAIDLLAALGADMLGLNPLHALYPVSPAQASPYSPSSRRFLNPAYLHIEAMQDFAECEHVREQVEGTEFQARLSTLRASELVDYEHVVPLKLGVLHELYLHFRDRHLATDSERARHFDAFRHAYGTALRRHAVFEALHARYAPLPHTAWPAALRDPDSPAVHEFADAHADEIGCSQYVQWQCALQLASAAQRAATQGMRTGLYLDLAVGSDGHGADAWADSDLLAHDVSIGAPPDDFSLQGQVWGLPPWTPLALREQGYEPFASCLRANMRAAGALRIDHVLGLMRLFWIPSGEDAAHGAYVNYPVHDLLAITALESRRARCVVVGEDLGTVPDEIRAALAHNGVLSYRVLYFEKHWHGDHSFRAPDQYPEQALVTVATHDLATLAGYWVGRDLDLRDALGLFPSPEAAAGQREERHHDRWRLLEALEHQGLRPDGLGEPGAQPPGDALVRAVHQFLARSPAAILSVQMEDVLGETEQVNVPGTVHEHANWRRKLSAPLEAWAGHAPLRALAEAVNRERARDRSL